MIADCAGALRLRRIAIRLFAADVTILHASLTEELASVPVSAWRIFLAEEGCAAVLGGRLTKLGLITTLTPDVQRVITTQTLVETQRVLGVKAQLAAVARIAKQQDWHDIVVLKGGVQVAENGDVMFIHDLDLLARGEVVAQLVEQLRSTGYDGGEEDEAHHLTPLTSDSGVSVELHTRWDRDAHAVSEEWWQSTLPLASYAPLRQPSHAHQLRHLLWHMVEHHAELRGRLRDMLPAARAWGRMQHPEPAPSPTQSQSWREALADLEAAIARHPMHVALRTTLQFAQDIDSGPAADPFERRAAGRYVIRAVRGMIPVPDMLRGQLIALTLALVDRPTDLSIYVRRVLPTIWRVRSRTSSELRLGWAARAGAKVVKRIAAQGAVAFLAPALATMAERALARSR